MANVAFVVVKHLRYPSPDGKREDRDCPSMFVDPVPSAEGRELIQGYAANKARQGLHTNLIHYGFALFAPVAYATVGLVRQRGAWIANLAGLFAVIGLSMLPGLVLLDYFSVGVEQVAGLMSPSMARRRPRGYQTLQP
jgi:hypothetical protein